MGRLVVPVVFALLYASSSCTLAAEQNCEYALRIYIDKYDGKAQKTDISAEQQLSYLESIEKEICSSNGIFVFFKSQVLLRLHRFDEVKALLESADKQKIEPRSLVLDQRASILLSLKTTNLGNVTESFDNINAMLEEAMEIETKAGDTSSIPSTQYTMASVANFTGDYDKAACLLNDAIKNGKDLSSVFYTFAGVVAAKQRKWDESAKLMETAIKINNENYLNEPETIRAMAETFCQLNRKDLSEKAIALAIAANPPFADFPDIIAAQEETRQCPNPQLELPAQPAFSARE